MTVCAKATKAYPDGRTGTGAGYQAHLKAKEPACDQCSHAHRRNCSARFSELTEVERQVVRESNRKAHAKYRKESPQLSGATLLRFRQINRAIIREAKEVPCTDCGVEYPYYVMEFDHLGDKHFNVGQTGPTTGRERLIREIAKCEVVCANCHAARSHHRRVAAMKETA